MKYNDQFNNAELKVLLRELKLVLSTKVEGDIVELGCYKGMTSIEIATMLQFYKSGKKLFLYDSFAGLPEKVAQDASPAGVQFKAGELPATKAEVINLFKKVSLRLPSVRKAWFSELESGDLPDKIALAFLDGDFYESIRDSLKLIWPKLSTGAVIVIDDYQNEALPGAAKAVNEWLKTHPAAIKNEASLAILKRQL